MLVVVPALNRFDLLQDSLKRVCETAYISDHLVLDNGSATPIADEPWFRELDCGAVRLPENVGNYATFWEGLRIARDRGEDLVAFLHSDLMVYEKDWDRRVHEAFIQHPRLGLLGFIGSNEMEHHGGRGLGTCSNFQGAYPMGGSAEVHGRRETGLVPAANLDGCAMIFATEVLEQIPHLTGFPPHHFYDRLFCCQVAYAGYELAVLGVACDHLGMRTVAFEQAYHDLARRWIDA